MQTFFDEAQRRDPIIREADEILRKCVHCGFCTATCPTYVLLGDEADGPRGRIYLIKETLEKDRPASPTLATHVDRCLNCLACMTTCPSGVDFGHLVDKARDRIERTYARPFGDRALRGLLARVLPAPGLFRLVLLGGRLLRPLRRLLPGRLRDILALAPRPVPPSPVDRPQVFPAHGARRLRVALLTGCAQKVLRPAINEATVRLLTRHGVEVVVAKGGGCCGALVHHMGKVEQAKAEARANIAAWEAAAAEDGGLDAIVVNASGCGTEVKDYGHLFAGDPDWAERAARIAALARDVSEVLAGLDLAADGASDRPVVAYHSACALQHGQGIKDGPQALLRAAGFTLREPVESHLCCGSAGTYNLLQPALARQLGARKAANLSRTGAAVVATGNIGCLVQVGNHLDLPVVHTVELLDWATGGPKPAGLP